MAVDDPGRESLMATSGGNVAVAVKPLKKKRSLTRLFSSASRVSSRSRPLSPQDPSTPPTPEIPSHFGPSNISTSETPRIPSMNFNFFINDELNVDPVGRGILRKDDGDSLDNGWGLAKSSEEAVPIYEVNGTSKSISEPASRKCSVASRHAAISPTLDADKVPQAGKAMVHYPPIPLGLPKPFKTGLRKPSSFETNSKDRGASVMVPHTKGSPAQPHLIRPSTAGTGNFSRPTGKRKPKIVHTDLVPGDTMFPTFSDIAKIPQHPWQNTQSSDELRSSFRSALTASSDRQNSASIDRSSVLTKGTSFSELITDVLSRPTSKAGGMTVDDAIELYAAGFADDYEANQPESRDTSISEGDRRRSIKIAEALNDSIGELITPIRPSRKESIGFSATTSPEVPPRGSQLPPPILPPSTTRDQYGFLKATHHINTAHYDLWSNDYLPGQQRRMKKWATFLQDQGLSTHLPVRFPNPSAKTERFIRKGIPPRWRGSVWFFYAGGQSYIDRFPDLYSALVSRSEAELSSNDKEAIERDLNRTFPDNVYFKPDPYTPSQPPTSSSSANEQPILTSLRNVLRAFALHHPKIGYCQSLNFISGLLLLFLSEEKTFWLLHVITTIYLPGTHEISLEGANVDLWVLMVALKSTMPGIWAKVGAAGTPGDELLQNARLPPISLCTTSWFMSLFIGTLPIETVLRVWDVLFYEGSRTLFRVALTIFKIGEQRIRDVGDSMELFQVVQSLPRGMLDANAMMKVTCRRGGVGSRWVEDRRRERRDWYAKERARVATSTNATKASALAEYFAPAENTPEKDGDAIERKESIWKRRRRKGSGPAAAAVGRHDGIPPASGQDMTAI